MVGWTDVSGQSGRLIDGNGNVTRNADFFESSLQTPRCTPSNMYVCAYFYFILETSFHSHPKSVFLCGDRMYVAPPNSLIYQSIYQLLLLILLIHRKSQPLVQKYIHALCTYPHRLYLFSLLLHTALTKLAFWAWNRYTCPSDLEHQILLFAGTFVPLKSIPTSARTSVFLVDQDAPKKKWNAKGREQTSQENEGAEGKRRRKR